MEISAGKNLSRTWVISLGVLALIGPAVYIYLASRFQAIGFPLDDAWIHQTYARNLADRGEWAFLPGTHSAGSTSPLWTLLLTIPHLLARDVPYGLTYLLGSICLWGVACLGEMIFRRGTVNTQKYPYFGLMLVLEWHLVWAAVSGMETALIAALVLSVFYFLQKGTEKGFMLAGLLTGIGIGIRPDAITLAGPLVWSIFLSSSTLRERMQTCWRSLAAGAIPVAGYLMFNYLLSGQIWPLTFYAKQAEYAESLKLSLLNRNFNLAALPLVGVGVFLLPGFVYQVVHSIRQRSWFWSGMILWWLGYTLVYALRLPVADQPGRYLIPAMPVFFLIGFSGALGWVHHWQHQSRTLWILQRVWQVSTVLVLATFFISGGRSYAQDVAIINTEMVATAYWVAENTDREDLIAVHDIGAMGYFGQRNLVDLAGLVSPEVIPIIRNEDQLARLLNEKGASYLVIFPDWYAHLTDGKEIVFQTGAPFAPAAGGVNMAVYRWMED
jgi:hypothetical protein